MIHEPRFLGWRGADGEGPSEVAAADDPLRTLPNILGGGIRRGAPRAIWSDEDKDGGNDCMDLQKWRAEVEAEIMDHILRSSRAASGGRLSLSRDSSRLPDMPQWKGMMDGTSVSSSRPPGSASRGSSRYTVSRASWRPGGDAASTVSAVRLSEAVFYPEANAVCRDSDSLQAHLQERELGMDLRARWRQQHLLNVGQENREQASEWRRLRAREGKHRHHKHHHHRHHHHQKHHHHHHHHHHRDRPKSSSLARSSRVEQSQDTAAKIEQPMQPEDELVTTDESDVDGLPADAADKASMLQRQAELVSSKDAQQSPSGSEPFAAMTKRSTLRTKVGGHLKGRVARRRQSAKRLAKIWGARQAFMLTLQEDEVTACRRAFGLYAAGDAANEVPAEQLPGVLYELGLRGSQSQERWSVEKLCKDIIVRISVEEVCGQDAEKEGQMRAEISAVVPSRAPSLEGHPLMINRGSFGFRATVVNLPPTVRTKLVKFEDFVSEVVPSVRNLLRELRYDAHLAEFTRVKKDNSRVVLTPSEFLSMIEGCRIDKKLAHEALADMRMLAGPKTRMGILAPDTSAKHAGAAATGAGQRSKAARR